MSQPRNEGRVLLVPPAFFAITEAYASPDRTASSPEWRRPPRRLRRSFSKKQPPSFFPESPIPSPPHLLTPYCSACIAHHATILTECTTSASSQTSSLASLILPKIRHDSPQKLTYTHGNHYIHYVAECPGDHPEQPSAGGLTFLVVSESSLGRRIPFGFLFEIRRRFFEAFPAGTEFADMPNYGAASFNGELRGLMVDYGTTAGGQNDAISTAKREIDDVRGIMTKNIEGLLERGERLDLLVDKTDRLGGSAREFRVRSRDLKRRMWWKNVKLMGLLAVVVILIIFTIVMSVRT